MTRERSFKRRVRERMSETGESYTAARRHVAEKRDRVRADRAEPASAQPAAPAQPAEPPPPADRPADERVEAATGRRWDAWFAILDEWGARERKHREMAAFLVGEHGVPAWWAQSITVSYERARGLRLKHQQADGFTVQASKTIAAPLDALFDAFVSARSRRAWLADGTMSLRTSQPGRAARFDWGDGATRVSVAFVDKGPAKATVTVAHERLPGPGEAEAAKAAWRERLTALKTFLEP